VEPRVFIELTEGLCCIPKEKGGLGILATQTQAQAPCTKWIFRRVEAKEVWKNLLKNCITSNDLLRYKISRNLNMKIVKLTTLACVHIKGTIVAKRIWKS
jgi:hypothetical protein